MYQHGNLNFGKKELINVLDIHFI